MVRMVTTSPHVYAGHSLAVNEEFDCEPQHVHLMQTLGRARPKADEAADRSPQYRTRDLTASGTRGRRKALAP